METLDNKLISIKQACIEVGFWEATQILSGLHRNKCCMRDKMLCTLFHIYNNHDHGQSDRWYINDNGLLVHVPGNDEHLSSSDKPWYKQMKIKWDLLLSPLPLYDKTSGCYKIAENDNVVATTPIHSGR